MIPQISEFYGWRLAVREQVLHVIPIYLCFLKDRFNSDFKKIRKPSALFRLLTIYCIRTPNTEFGHNLTVRVNIRFVLCGLINFTKWSAEAV